MIYHKEIEIGGRKLLLEVGRVAKQADGSAWVQYGDTVVLATVTSAKELADDVGFFPLSVDYRGKAYAAGKIPGGFIKREGRPTDKEILSARLIDRPIRPLFPEEFKYETQVMVSVLSSDQENPADTLGAIGTSLALMTSDIPFDGPIASVRVGRVDGEFIVNPTFSQLELSDMELVIAGSEDAIIMVEGEAREISEAEMLSALKFGHEYIKQIVQFQKDFLRDFPVKPKREVLTTALPENLENEIKQLSLEKIKQINRIPEKDERKRIYDELAVSVKTTLLEKYPEQENKIDEILYELRRMDMREMVLSEARRIDGRGLTDIRPISCEISVLPRTHGSAIFTRGQTQSLAVATLGTKSDEQLLDDLEGEVSKSYMLHYNFPPFSTGEVKPYRGPSRREIGHGNLAERALKFIIPSETDFPYTIRVVSDILESNGSSSMATVCSGALALMDAGVPIKSSVAGIAMGLVKEDNRVAILSDILGDEDHLGDMDFKVAGTRQGITAFQMDVKIKGISFEIMENALKQAKEGRFHILDIMDKTIDKPKRELSPYAPRILSFKVSTDVIGLIIGQGGKTIRDIIDKTGVKIDIEDDGTVVIASSDLAACDKAKKMIDVLIEQPEAGKVYTGKITRIVSFGAFVEILPGKEGLLHISEIDHKRINRVEDVFKVGDEVTVKLKEIDQQGKFNLSRKDLLIKEEALHDKKTYTHHSSHSSYKKK